MKIFKKKREDKISRMSARIDELELKLNNLTKELNSKCDQLHKEILNSETFDDDFLEKINKGIENIMRY